MQTLFRDATSSRNRETEQIVSITSSGCVSVCHTHYNTEYIVCGGCSLGRLGLSSRPTSEPASQPTTLCSTYTLIVNNSSIVL